MKTDVWVLFPKNRRLETGPARHVIRAFCRACAWDYQERPSREVIVAPTGRKSSLVSGADADELYRRAHIARVGVVWFGSAHVCVDPTAQERYRDRVLTGIEDFMRYKAFCRNITIDQPTVWSSHFEHWCDTVGCEGEHDPRCLPFHVFRARPMRLEEVAGREQFARLYGSGSIRVDLEKMEWKLAPRDFHSGVEAHIAGCNLRQGFHWDVKPSSAGPKKIMTTIEAWLVNRYINVYPNAHIRNAAGGAKRIFP